MNFLIKTTAIARLSLPVYQNLIRNIVVSWLREKEGKRERSPRKHRPTNAETGEGGRVSQSVNRSGADAAVIAVKCNAKVNGEEAEEAKGERKRAKERKGKERAREREK